MESKRRSCHECEHHYFDIYGNICKLDMGYNEKDFNPNTRAQDCPSFTKRHLEECPECGILTDTLYDGMCGLCYDDRMHEETD